MDEQGKSALAQFQKMIDDGVPIFNHVLMPPMKMYSENGALVIEAANANHIAGSNQATVVRIVIPGGMALQLRNLLNQSQFEGSEEMKPSH